VPAGSVSVVETLTPLVVEQAETATNRRHADRFTCMLENSGEQIFDISRVTERGNRSM
jgi:hypothetical protein